MSRRINHNQQYNRLICDLLIAAVERFPEWRFGQILRNLELVKEIVDGDDMPCGWKNDINTSSSDILRRAGKYREILKALGAHVDGNALMAIKRLKVDESARHRKKVEIKEKREK